MHSFKKTHRCTSFVTLSGLRNNRFAEAKTFRQHPLAAYFFGDFEMNSDKPTRIVRRLPGIRRIGIAVATYHDWASPMSPRYKPDLPRLVKIGGAGSFASGFIEAELDAWIESRSRTGC